MKHKKNQVRDENIARLYLTGRTHDEISTALGLGRSRVHAILKSFGYTRKDGGSSIRSARKRADLLNKMNSKYMEKYGMSFSEIRDFRRDGTMRFFVRQKTNAKHRGIQWLLKFSEWWNAWKQSGQWEKRGRGAGYVMARMGDCGPYSVDNIYFCTGKQNTEDSYLFKPVSTRKKRERQQA